MRILCLRLMMLSAPLLLMGCGDGWEAQRTTEILPYGNQRTAGSGVVYVRAKMLPEKELVVEAPAAEPEVEVAPMAKADKVFSEAQVKGASAKKPSKKKEEVKPEEPKEKEAMKEETKDEMKASQEKAEVVPAAGSDQKAAEVAVPEKAASKSYEQGLDDSLNDKPFSPEKVEPHAGIDIIDVPEETYPLKGEKASSLPNKEIMSPKVDVYRAQYDGQKSLDEIYSSPF